jgi:hypothetical protein
MSLKEDLEAKITREELRLAELKDEPVIEFDDEALGGFNEDP